MSKTEKIFLGIILLLSTVIIWDRMSYSASNTDTLVIKYLDSIIDNNSKLINKVDSLQKLKTNQYAVYNEITKKYDTVRINIDTLSPLEATKLLLSMSRQLNAEGVE